MSKQEQMTTDEIDHTTPEERNRLFAFCELCQAWYLFVRDEDDENHTCGSKPSTRVGHQVTSERTHKQRK